MTTTFFRTFLVLVALAALATGCSSDPNHNTNTGDASISQDGGQTDSGKDITTTGDQDGLTSWDQIEVGPNEGLAAIELDVPDKKPATFYICVENTCNPMNPGHSDSKVFKDTNHVYYPFSISKLFDFDTTVFVERQNYLFVDWHSKIKGGDDFVNTVKFNWSAPYSWGLAPNNGNCTDSFSGKPVKISTDFKNGKLEMNYDNSLTAWISNNTFIETDHEPIAGMKFSGTISEDLSTIQYHFVLGDTVQDGTITCK